MHSPGEALIDVVIRPGSIQEHVGGSPLNVAVGLATLGDPASICAHRGADKRGDMLRQRAEPAGLEIVAGTDSAEKTPVAFAHVNEHGHATYDFDLNCEVPLSDVGKASAEGLGWLYPDTPAEDIIRRWVRTGPAIVVCGFRG